MYGDFDTVIPIRVRPAVLAGGAVLQTLVARPCDLDDARRVMTTSHAPPICVSRRGAKRGDADHAIVWLRGEHDISTKISVCQAVLRAGRSAPVLVDLAGVTFMDASTIGALVASRNRLRARGQSLQVRAPSARARRVLDLCGLAHLIELRSPATPDPAAALRTWVDVLPSEPGAAVDLTPVPSAMPAASWPLEVDGPAG